MTKLRYRSSETVLARVRATLTADITHRADDLVEQGVGGPVCARGQAPLRNTHAWIGDPEPTLLLELRSDERRRLAEIWEVVGLRKHAAIATYAQIVVDLLSVQASPELVEAATDAIHAQTEHARIAFGLASAYRGVPVGPGVLPVGSRICAQRANLQEVVRALVVEGCLGATLAAVEAAVAGTVCEDEGVRQVLGTLAEDELTQATFAWSFVAWAIQRDPVLVRGALARTLDEAGEAIEAGRGTDDLSLAVHGVLGSQARCSLRRDALRCAIMPCAGELLAL